MSDRWFLRVPADPDCLSMQVIHRSDLRPGEDFEPVDPRLFVQVLAEMGREHRRDCGGPGCAAPEAPTEPDGEMHLPTCDDPLCLHCWKIPHRLYAGASTPSPEGGEGTGR